MIVKKMSSTSKGLDIAFFRTYRDKLVGLLFENITHLNIMFYQSDSIEHRDRMKLALEKLENTLKILGYMERQLSNKEYEFIKSFVDLTVKQFI